MKIRPATREDIGELAYMILQWATNELPENLGLMDSTAWQSERTAQLIVSSNSYVTRVLDDNGQVVGAYVMMLYGNGTFGSEPYASLLGVYVKPDKRSYKFHGLKLIMDAQQIATELGLSRLEINPMPGSKGMQAVLQRLGYLPMCITHTKRLNHG